MEQEAGKQERRIKKRGERVVVRIRSGYY